MSDGGRPYPSIFEPFFQRKIPLGGIFRVLVLRGRDLHPGPEVMSPAVRDTTHQLLVAGPGFAPGSRGYEPREVLLLHPAIYEPFRSQYMRAVYSYSLKISRTAPFSSLPGENNI